MKPTPIILTLLAIVVALSFLEWRGCQASQQAAFEIQQANAKVGRAIAHADSASEAQKSAYTAYQMEKVQWAADSAWMARQHEQDNQAVNAEKAAVGGLVSRLRAAEVQKDTTAYYQSCDSLASELTRAKLAVIDLQENSDASITACGQELDRRDSVISAMRAAALGMKRAVDSLAEASRQQAQANAKLASQASKRFSIGPGVTGTIIGGKFQPVFGIDVHYTLFRF